MTQILVLDNRVKEILGGIGDEQLPPGILASYRDNNLNLALAEMTISNAHQRGRQAKRTLQAGVVDYQNLPSDFWRPIWCETLTTTGYRDEYIEPVALGDLINRDSRHKAVAFWAQDPTLYRLSWSPANSVEIRFAYEPADEHAKVKTSPLEIRDIFLWMVATDIAVDVISFVDFEPQKIRNPNVRMDTEANLLRPGGLHDRWHKAWMTEMVRSPIEGPTYMRPFSAYNRR